MLSSTRREALFASLAVPLARAFGAEESRVCAASYIFQQYAERQHKTLADVLDEVIPMTRQAGFHSIELMSGFFTPELSARTLALVRQNRLQLPSVYSGGVLH